jgi:hypothetical protein
VQSQQVHKAFEQASHVSSEKASPDAINRSRGRQDDSPIKRPGFQPGQDGEQIGGHGKEPMEGSKGERRAATSSTSPGLFGSIKKILGIGSSDRRRFHTSAYSSVQSSRQRPSPSNDEHVIKPKEHKPDWVGRPEESHILVSTPQPSAEYTHVRGTPEPDSYQRGYEYVHGKPSGAIAASSTSTDPPHSTLPLDQPRNAKGVGSSHAVIRESADAAASLQNEGDTIRPKQTESLVFFPRARFQKLFV